MTTYLKHAVTSVQPDDWEGSIVENDEGELVCRFSGWNYGKPGRIIIRNKNDPRRPIPVALEQDGIKIYGPHISGGYSAAWGGQWMEGGWATVEEALEGARGQIDAGN